MGQKFSTELLFILHQWILHIYISQGSIAMQLRCGGAFSNLFITNFPQNVPVKKFWKSVNIWRRYRQQFGLLFGPPCILFKTGLKPGFEQVCNLSATSYRHFGGKKSETCGRLTRSASVETWRIDVFGLWLFYAQNLLVSLCLTT